MDSFKILPRFPFKSRLYSAFKRSKMSGFRSNKQLIDYLVSNGTIRSQMVENAMRSVDRGNYSDHPNIYNDCPQGIGYAVTISAPHMV